MIRYSLNDFFEKGKKTPIGTISSHGGKKVIKTIKGWRPLPKGHPGHGKVDPEPEKPVTPEPEPIPEPPKPPPPVVTITEPLEYFNKNVKWQIPVTRRAIVEKLCRTMADAGGKVYTQVEEAESPAYYQPSSRKIFMSAHYRSAKTFVHEVGHASHNIYGHISGTPTAEMQEAKRMLHADMQYGINSELKEGLRALSDAKSAQRIAEKSNDAETLGRAYDKWANKKMQLKRLVQKNSKTSAGSEEYGAIMDTFAAASRGVFGYGHDMDYWKERNSPHAEMFVHALCAYVFNWRSFKTTFPRYYDTWEKTYIKDGHIKETPDEFKK